MHLFFNYDGDFESVANYVFENLGMECTSQDSLNCLSREYYFSVFLNMKIKLELNSYDFEDEYAYFLYVDKYASSNLNFPDEIDAEILAMIRKVITYIPGIDFFIEENGVLKILPRNWE